MKRKLPIGWTRRSIDEVASHVTSGSRGWSNYEAMSGPRFYGVGDLPREGIKIQEQATRYVCPPKESGEGLRTRVRAGDILISITADLGRIGFVASDLSGEGYVNQHLALVRMQSKDLEPEFVACVLSGQDQRVRLLRLDDSSAKSGLNLETIRSFDFPLPPKDEQRRIVAVLDAWDRAIDQTERLITAKRRQKAGLFQQLFLNLPRRPLLEAADVWFSAVDKKSRDDEAPILLCNYMNVFHNARITAQIAFMQATASKRQIADNTLRKDDVVFTKDSETADEIAEPALVGEDIPNLVCGYHLAVARPREGVGHRPFIAQAMRHHAMRWQFSRLANGVVRFGLTLNALEQAEIFLPPLPMQQRIAAILDAQDVAIEGLAKQAETLRTQKRGLMHRLLSGDWQLDHRFDAVPVYPPNPIAASELAI